MDRKTLTELTRKRQSFLCVGLDTDVKRLPKHLTADYKGVVAFNKAIIDATKDTCVAYKINTAFYELLGSDGWQAMEETVAYIGKDHFTIADAKRGDIGNTSAAYARTFFETYGFDAVTVAPYMGEDSIKPFLEYKEKFTIALGLTSNTGSNNFQRLTLANGKKVYEEVLETISKWGTPDNLMFVIGATQAQELKSIRLIIPDHYLLVPGVGTQGGSLQDVASNGMTADTGLLVNVSRDIIYAGNNEAFRDSVRNAARKYHEQMKTYF